MSAHPKELKTVNVVADEMKAVGKLLKTIKNGTNPDIYQLISDSDIATKKWRLSEKKASEYERTAFCVAYTIYLFSEAKEEYRKSILDDIKAHDIPMPSHSHISIPICKRYLDSENSAASFQAQAMRSACSLGLDADALLQHMESGKWSLNKLVKRLRQSAQGHRHPTDPQYIYGDNQEDDDGGEADKAMPRSVMPLEEGNPKLTWPEKYLARWNNLPSGHVIRITMQKTSQNSARIISARREK